MDTKNKDYYVRIRTLPDSSSFKMMSLSKEVRCFKDCSKCFVTSSTEILLSAYLEKYENNSLWFYLNDSGEKMVCCYIMLPTLDHHV